MKLNSSPFMYSYVLLVLLTISSAAYSQNSNTALLQHEVTLKKAHIGNLEIDTLLLDSYGAVPDNIKQFYLEARYLLANKQSDFTSKGIIKSARKHSIPLLGGPLLGNLKDDGLTLWLRTASVSPLTVVVTNLQTGKQKNYAISPEIAGKEYRINLDGLIASTDYSYKLLLDQKEIAQGHFSTAPKPKEKGVFRLCFGSCYHKIGIHNPNLTKAILHRKPNAMLLLGDIAVDDRENKFNLHRSDYLLRDISKAWKKLSANVPLYTSWDDHDYLNNDLSGMPPWFSQANKEEIRSLWMQNWNNPPNKADGIYFSTRIGPTEVIMLDTRSCRTVEKRGQYGSYLGKEQQAWLLNTLKKSTAPFKVISSGTMWSDYVSNGKDSWGTWDTLAREEIFRLIETENISGVLLISGDRHGARAFKLPRPSGFKLYEFEAASLGGVPGPPSMAKDSTNQLFGYLGNEIVAFGEFSFDLKAKEPQLTFRLINQYGKILEEHTLTYEELSPIK